MSLEKLRTLIHQVMLEEAKKKDKKEKESKGESKGSKEKKETKKSSGKLMDLKNELKSLKTMKESLAQHSVNEAIDTQSLTEFTHLQKFVTEIERIREATGNLSVALDEHINEVEGKITEETQKIKEMMGLISEDEVAEGKKKPSAGMTKKEKSALAKKAHKGGDVGKKGKGFEKVVKAAEKQYGSKEAGQRVAAAAMWKQAAK